MVACRRDRRIEESAWVAEVEAAVADGGASEEVARWWRHCIYHVPACIKDLNPKAYRPQVVSLGPFHHGEAQLRPMDAHKRRALVHFLRRARRPLAEFAAAVAGGVAAEEYERLEGAYEGLGSEWRGAAGEERFVELMVTDGCGYYAHSGPCPPDAEARRPMPTQLLSRSMDFKIRGRPVPKR